MLRSRHNRPVFTNICACNTFKGTVQCLHFKNWNKSCMNGHMQIFQKKKYICLLFQLLDSSFIGTEAYFQVNLNGKMTMPYSQRYPCTPCPINYVEDIVVLLGLKVFNSDYSFFYNWQYLVFKVNTIDIKLILDPTKRYRCESGMAIFARRVNLNLRLKSV